MMHTYSLENFSFSYPGQEQSALSQLTFDIAPGEILLLCGSSGCGKTTLLRQLKPNLAPPGRRSGTLLFQGRPLAELSQREQAQAIGFVQQSPENQIVTDKVWHELAFGLESLGLDTAEMRLRIAEMASFFGIQEWFRDSVSSLSGGQKQLLNLASVMVMHPEALILDEPTSQLDPIAAREFLDILVKVNRELGTTIIISEHRLEEIYPLADRVLVLDSGQVTSLGTPRQVAAELHQLQHPMFQALPAPLRIWSAVPEAGSECPLTPGEGRNWLAARQQKYPLNPAAIPQYNESTNELLNKPIASDPPLIRVKDVSFRYERDGRDVLRNLSMTVWPGEIYALVGGNGVGKSTTLSLLSGLHHPQRGKVEIDGRPIERIPHSELYGGLVASLPQNPQSLFLRKTLELDLLEVLEQRGLSREEQEQRLRTVCRLCQLESLLSMHPYDLSGGEQQRAALAKVLLLAPRILLLDEPTKGLDAHFKKQLAHILRALCDFGVAVVLVSHDIEFCAAYADRCAMFFDGTVVAEHSPRRFFSDQNFYTTSTHRMARKLLPQAVLAEDVIAAAGGSSGRADCSFGYDADDSFDRELRRFFERAAKKKEKAASASPNFAGAEADVAEREEKAMNSVAEEKSVREPRRPLGRRSKWVIILSLLCVPLTVLAGMYLLDDSRYYLVSMLIILETLLPFILNFEGRKPKTRELVVIAVLVALGTVGRAICSFIPNVEPVAAIVVISGICLGCESGFLVGAVTAFVSNMLMGQGPWTPWQMLGFGLVGLVSGLVYRWGWLRMKRLPISIFGFLATVIIYGGLLNPAFVLMYQPEPTWEMILTAYAGGIPFDLLHGASTFIFLFILALPMSEKLARIKEKYGLDS